jgi:M6 family metalloprotease-like protein
MRDAAGEQEGHGWIGARMREFVAEAIRLADPDIDFGLYDNSGPDGIPNSGDDDGFVDGFAIRYFEVSGSCGGPAPWPHFGAARDSLGKPVETGDRTPAGAPIRVQVYIADSVMDCTGQEPDGVAVLAHEFGHVIGLPDLYRLYDGRERENRSWTAGCFDLMAAGAWGCGTGPVVPRFGPTQFSPLMKWRLGWLDFQDVEVADQEELVLQPSHSATSAVRVRLAPNAQEWFIFEYRTRAGFDRDLPGEGVLVYHFDELQDLRPVPEGVPPAYGYHLVEADGDDALRRSEVAGGNRGVAGDIFARGGTVAVLDDSSTPSTRDHLGGMSTVTVHSMRVDGDVARVAVSAGTGMHVVSRELLATPGALSPFDGLLRLSGGAQPYTATQVAGSLPPGLSAAMEGDALRITGEPLAAATFVASFLIRDATGRQLGEAVRLDVRDVTLPKTDLVQAIGVSGVLDGRTRQYLDRSGNGNGGYDLGDLRMYLLRTGEVR